MGTSSEASRTELRSLRGQQNAIIVGGGFTNKGAEAMTVTVARAIRTRAPNSLVFARTSPYDVCAARQAQTIPIVGRSSRDYARRLVDAVVRVPMYASCRVVFDVGGYQFGDPWGPGIAIGRAKLYQRFTRGNRSAILMPQAWGPFRNAEVASAARRALDACSLAYVRDATSAKEVADLVGPHPHVRSAHDIAWAFQGDGEEAGRELVRSAFRDESTEPFICVTPNLRVLERAPGEGIGNSYVQLLAHVVRRLIHNHGLRVLLLGHELRSDADRRLDDRHACRLVISVVGESASLGHLDRYLTAGQVKAVIGLAAGIVSSRYHAIIAAAEQGVVPLVAGWSHKYDELLREIGCSNRVLQVGMALDEVEAAVDGSILSASDGGRSIGANVDRLRVSARQALADSLDAAGWEG